MPVSPGPTPPRPAGETADIAGYRWDPDSEPDWRPLEQVARICHEHPTLPHVDPDGFMYMGQFVHPTRHTIVMYKHIATRRYLNLDHAGHAYAVRLQPECFLPGFDVDADCRVLGDLASAIARVQGLTHARPPARRQPLAL